MDIQSLTPLSMLEWQVFAGADEAIGDHPVNRYRAAETAAPLAAAQPAPSPMSAPAANPRPAMAAVPARDMTGASGESDARRIAAACRTLDELAEAIRGFDGCALKATATSTVFADGNPAAPLMLIGEAPGAEEDRQGLPFVGNAGQLLDKMLAAIGRGRDSAYIANILPWRPPGNRKPTPVEVRTCLPFIERHIELADPKLLVYLGGTSAGALMNTSEGIMRLRGRWGEWRGIPAMPTYHPAFLLRQPASKRDAWRDLLQVQAKLSELGA